ncbi:peptidoglycan-binding domain-containing protein [Corticibacter populi]|nr:peptidoglycan-binding domain-containing protein [Corticibacter populi]RZS33294.1 putative peptidoglycan binding protein [Corticibacter populi]
MREDTGRNHTIASGDSITAIARENGYLWSTLWDHPRNAALRQKRQNPNQLVAGDALYLPAKGGKSVSKPVDARHAFKLRGEPTRLQLQLKCLGEPRANEAYTISWGDQVVHGSTDGQGRIDETLAAQVRSVTLQLDGGAESYTLAVGELEPVSELRGLQQRLTNLGHGRCGSGELDDATRAALLSFQRAEALQETGEPDAATRALLEQRHG